jgi:Uma2 family endonuclease
MATLTIELPEQKAQTAFNLRRWGELVGDPELAKIEGRIETDRHGHIVMSPPPAAGHGRFQARIASLLEDLMTSGEAVCECPISTADGVKAADVAWASADALAELGNRICFSKAPEICVEVISPSNSEAEIREKMALYFNAGAREVWVCSSSGQMSFFSSLDQTLSVSQLCPQFPGNVQRLNRRT